MTQHYATLSGHVYSTGDMCLSFFIYNEADDRTQNLYYTIQIPHHYNKPNDL
jgi:hypothetical protein